MFALLAVFALRTFAQTNVLTMDSSGNLSAVGNLTGSTVISEAGVAGGTYTSGITAIGSATQTCLISFSNGGGTGGTASVALTGTNTIAGGAALAIVSPGQAYTNAPTTAAVMGGGTASCSGGSVAVATYLGAALDALVNAQPGTPASGHGRIWFDNVADWPLPAPMGVDSTGNNISAMVRTAKGTAVGAYTPFYWGVGGFGASSSAPASTWTVYDSTPTSVGPATVVTSGSITATSGGTYAGTSAVTYCVILNTTTTFTWGTGGPCSGGGGPTSLCTSPCSLSSGVTVVFSASTGTLNQSWTILASPGGTTNETIRAGTSQNGNLWTVESNSATPLWGISQAGYLVGYNSVASQTVSIVAPSSLSSSFDFNLPINAGTSGQVLTSAGGSSPMAWSTLSATNITTGTLPAAQLPNNTAATWFGSNGQAVQVGGGATMYMASGVPSAAGTPINASTWVTPVACVLRGFYVYLVSAQPGSGTLAFTIYDNGSSPNSLGTSTGLVVTFAASSSGQGSDTTHSYSSISPGDTLTVQVVNSATASSGKIGPWGVMCEPN
jgi:hypothetical protein